MSSLRSDEDAERYTLLQRQMMIPETLLDKEVDPRRVILIPFPVDVPRRWRCHLPQTAVQFIRVFAGCEREKVEWFRHEGYHVPVLPPGPNSQVEGKHLRALIESGGRGGF